MVKVNAQPDDSLGRSADDHFYARLRVTTASGETHEHFVDRPLGRDRDHPLPQGTLEAKFRDCARRALDSLVEKDRQALLLKAEGLDYEEIATVLEIEKTFDFFKATAASDHIDRVLLSGGASRVDGFAHAVEERFGAPVEAFDPFKKIAFEPKKLGVTDAESVVTTAAVAVGLALRRAGDR